MNKVVYLLDSANKETICMDLCTLLEEINRDRSDEWTDYDEEDWQDGLTFTNYELLEVIEV